MFRVLSSPLDNTLDQLSNSIHAKFRPRQVRDVPTIEAEVAEDLARENGMRFMATSTAEPEGARRVLSVVVEELAAAATAARNRC